eukprot:TRINITY_DN2497_c0_g1_i11.p1 TRINITY_DN2497_c0_g1~~TRINITY_DN2497_c0_g1_i11.p1  ORF type:complete len:210 (-),score=32.08 TRINITY_DN2497_c0_g1_i11:219-848(-)
MQSSNPQSWRIIATVLERAVSNMEARELTFDLRKTCFDAVKVPSISLRSYLARLHKYANCSDSCFVVAFAYIDRALQNGELAVSGKSIHRIVLLALLLAIKYSDDEYADNQYYSKVGGISLPELNLLESEMLRLLNFDLYVSPQLYSQYLHSLRVFSQKIDRRLNSPRKPMEVMSKEDCGEKNLNTVRPVNSMGSIRTVESSNEVSAME